MDAVSAHRTLRIYAKYAWTPSAQYSSWFEAAYVLSKRPSLIALSYSRVDGGVEVLPSE